MKTILTGESDWTLPNTGVSAYPNMVDAPSAKPDSDGQKYILAGTPMSASQDATQSGNQVVTLTPTNDPTKVQGILRYDVNVVSGPKKAALVTAGEGNINNMNPQIQQIYNANFIKQLKQTLPKLQLINRP